MNARHYRREHDAIVLYFRRSREAAMAEEFIPPQEGYAGLVSYRKAEIVYDATVYFCGRFFGSRDRTRDQLVQAARSGKQNIIEGSQISGTSKETEQKMTNVDRSSLEELLADYRDFFRTRQLHDWDKLHPNAVRLRELNRLPNPSYETFRKGIEHPDRRSAPMW